MRKFAVLVGLCLALAAPASALAASSSASTAESLTVVGAASISISGVPASVSFGSVTTNGNPGSKTSGSATNGYTPISDSLVVNAVNVTTWSLTIAQSDMTGSGTTIPAVGGASFLIDTIGGGADPTFAGLGATPYSAPISGAVTSTTSPSGNFGLAEQWTIPASANGAYTSTLTLAVSGS